MTFKYNVTGAKRKELVNAISEITETPVKYLGAPSFAYEVDYFTIDKNGGVTFDDRADSEEIEMLVEALLERGFGPEAGFTEAEPTEEETVADDASEPDETRLCISMPQSLFTEAALLNLDRLLEAKGELIKKALGVSELPVVKVDGKVCFPWFNGEPTPEEIKAYDHFICALCEMARNQKRVTAKEKDTENEKYAFRCFLLRLGFIGAEYKEMRKILLRNLEGNGSFKSGARKEPAAPIADNEDTADDCAEALADETLIQEVNASFESEAADEQ
ncbi:MAG: virulence protein [Eubacteriales bacterium]|nr:virulence protein [Eubacteriales bacterium]